MALSIKKSIPINNGFLSYYSIRLCCLFNINPTVGRLLGYKDELRTKLEAYKNDPMYCTFLV